MTAAATPAIAEMTRAVLDQDCDKIRLLHRRGFDLESVDKEGLTVLHWAAMKDKTEAAATLLALGARPDGRSAVSGFTPLYSAAYAGHPGMIGLLLKNCADPDLADADGSTPLHAAAHGGLKAAMALVNGGADITRRDQGGLTALELAARNAAERLQFAREPYLEIAAYLKAETEALKDGTAPERARARLVSNDIAALKRRNPQRFKLKP